MNHDPAQRFFEYGALRLRDSQGRVFISEPYVSTRVAVDQPINFQFDPSIPTDTVAVFDVALDAGQTFILKSTADPAFREEVSLETRG
jgi:hypothetical protein